MESSNPDGNLLEWPVPVEAEAPVLTKTQRSSERLLELVRLGGCVCLAGLRFYLCSYFVFLSDWGCQEHSVQGGSVTSVRAELGWAVGLQVLRLWGRESLTSECTHWHTDPQPFCTLALERQIKCLFFKYISQAQEMRTMKSLHGKLSWRKITSSRSIQKQMIPQKSKPAHLCLHSLYFL